MAIYRHPRIISKTTINLYLFSALWNLFIRVVWKIKLLTYIGTDGNGFRSIYIYFNDSKKLQR